MARPPWLRWRRVVAVAAVVVVVTTVLAAGPSARRVPLPDGGRRAPDRRRRAHGHRDDPAGVVGECPFPISGTVAEVNVNVGDSVSVGQPLASLDPASLLADLDTQRQSLTEAQLTLDNALSGASLRRAAWVAAAWVPPARRVGRTRRCVRSGPGRRRRLGWWRSTPRRRIPRSPTRSRRSSWPSTPSTSPSRTRQNALSSATNVCAPIGNNPSTPPTPQQVLGLPAVPLGGAGRPACRAGEAERPRRRGRTSSTRCCNSAPTRLLPRPRLPPATSAPPATTAPPVAAGERGSRSQPAGAGVHRSVREWRPVPYRLRRRRRRAGGAAAARHRRRPTWRQTSSRSTRPRRTSPWRSRR